MKKNLFKLGLITGTFVTLSIAANAQWSRNSGTGVTYLTNGSDKVGIGTTAPSYKLDIKESANCNFRVQSTSSGSANLILARSSSAGTNALVNYKTGTTDKWFTGLKGNNDDFSIQDATGTAVFFISQSSKNVGVGTSSPPATLSVKSTSLGGIGTTGSFQIGEANTYNLVLDNNEVQARYNSGAGTLYLQYWAGDLSICNSGGNTYCYGPAYFYGASTYVGGKLGIGTTTPTYNLDIQGANSTASYYNCNSQVNYVGSADIRAFRGYSHPADGWGYGVEAYGGWRGVYGVCSNGAFGGGIGVYGSSSGTAGTQYGVYGYASGGATNWGVYSAGYTYSTSGYSTSDAKLKKDVRPLENAMDKINQLQAHTYTFKSDEYKYMGLPTEQQYGFIAQELEKVFPELVRDVEQPIDNDAKKNGTLQFKAVNYTELIPVLTQALQDQDKTIKDQDKTIKELKLEMADIKLALQSCCTNYTPKSSPAVETDKAGLGQNQPNPFNEKTVINYYLPSDVNSAVINITSATGQVVRTFVISAAGAGQVEINANALSSGNYTYQLVVDGKAIDSKQMVITK